jgi:hypothetical protein
VAILSVINRLHSRTRTSINMQRVTAQIKHSCQPGEPSGHTNQIIGSTGNGCMQLPLVFTLWRRERGGELA